MPEIKQIDVADAERVFDDLVGEVCAGQTVVFLRDGKAIAKMVPIGSEVKTDQSRIGFLDGALEVPGDFDRMGQAEIEGTFDGRKT